MTDAPNLKLVTNPSEASRLIDMAGDAVRGGVGPLIEQAREVYAAYIANHPRGGDGDASSPLIKAVRAGECDASHGVQIALAALTPKTASIDVLREALIDLVSWFPDGGPTSYGPWIIKAGPSGADDAVAAARAALRLHNEGEGHG